MPYTNIPDEKQEPMEACVVKVVESGKDKEAAIRICYASVMGEMSVSEAVKMFDLGDLEEADTKEFAEPDAPNYRKAAEGKPCCADCAHMGAGKGDSGRCMKYEFAAQSDHVCDDHEAMKDMSFGPFFADLSGMSDGRPFDGLAPGDFIDAHMQAVKVSASDFDAVVSNTRAAIEATRGENGELAGLPIDARNHDKGDAAGWIVGIERAGDIIRLTPKWTEIGVELIGKAIQRWFSATFDPVRKVILGGTLTNWPATRDKSGRILLRPIELSGNLSAMVAASAAETKTPKKEKVKEEAMEFDKLTPEQRASLVAEARQQVMGELSSGGASTDEVIGKLRESLKGEALAEVADLGAAREAMLSGVKTALEGEYKRIQAQAGAMLAELMAGIKRDTHIAELSQRLAQGSDETPRALPVTRERLEKFLTGLSDPQRAEAEAILTETVKSGLVNFAELGHGKNPKGVTPLPSEFAEKLDSGELKIADLSSPLIADLIGDLSRYDLSKWQGKE